MPHDLFDYLRRNIIVGRVTLTREDKIAVLTINRPEVKNALDMETYEEFGKAIEKVKSDPDSRVVVITGAGDSFCAGLDLKFAATIKDMSAVEVVGLIKRLQEIFTFESVEKPVISAIKGYTLGNGCDIALASDFVIAAENARIGMIYTNLGLIPDIGGTFRLPRLVGLSMAREMILTGEQIDAARALDIGMVNKVVPTERLMDETMEFAGKLAGRAPIALAMAKAAINKALGVDLHTAHNFEAYMQSVCLQSSDVMEAVSAFLEKRKPDFKGK